MLNTRQKYGNHKTWRNGKAFDSKKEAARHSELLLMQRAGVIAELETQKEFTLIPAQYSADEKTKRGTPKCIEQAIKYKADFYYYDKERQRYVCEDTKGFRTKDYIIKRKLMLYVHGIRITEL